ncbi:hypothetical protein HBE96_19535 [Clostridium sp. P21]|uniref:Uncharacterized protein n=1 Tax=Clostridium muellerianum TaxID=2716538 RepID=A0A7Y0HR43_9CLOT|nr:hypothetical protein [Clostridium muellerianum]NMM64801.1 hypothetical protein [Clostridium muellerianum]
MKSVKQIIDNLSKPYVIEPTIIKRGPITEFIEQKLLNKVNELPEDDKSLISLYKKTWSSNN